MSRQTYHVEVDAEQPVPDDLVLDVAQDLAEWLGFDGHSRVSVRLLSEDGSLISEWNAGEEEV